MEETHGDDAAKEKFFPNAAAAGCGDDLGPLKPICLMWGDKLKGEMRIYPMRGQQPKKPQTEADGESNE